MSEIKVERECPTADGATSVMDDGIKR